MGNNVRLSWLKDPNADSYIIQKESIDEFGKHVAFEPITTQQISYLDSEVAIDITYVYRLDKVRGSITYKGIETSVYSLMRDAPFPDTIVASNLGSKALLSWKNDVNVDSYMIQKQSIDIDNNTSSQSIPWDKTSYLDNDVVIDMIYVYRLDKIRGGTTYEGLSLTTFSTTRPDPFPGVIVAESLGDGTAAHLSWEPDVGADKYIVLRALNTLISGLFDWHNITNNLQMLSDVSAIDTQIDDDKSYVYRLDKERNNKPFYGNQVTVFAWNRPPPFDEAPVVDSFRSDKTIKISWNADIGADIYKLYRCNDSDSPNAWELIYQGTDFEFVDNTAVFENFYYKRYVYHLSKIRNGTPYFENFNAKPFTETLAVAVPTEKDPNEPNDDYLNATLLNISIKSNIYCFKFTGDRVLEDRDWYKVNVPAGKKAILYIHYITQGTNGMLKVYEPSQLEAFVDEGVDFDIKNESLEQKFVYFAIMPDRDKFSIGLGGQMIIYTIYWRAITD
jgi:hypothetical protein